LQAQLAAGAHAVVRRELLAQALADLLPDDPREHVATVPRRRGNDDADRLDRVSLREGAAGERSRGGKQDH